MSFRQSEERATRNLQSILRMSVEPEVPTGDPHVGHFIPSSTVVFGFAYGSSRKASIKEFHQLVSLTVTTPLRMTGLGFPFLQICHSDRETVRFRRGIYSFILIYTDFFLTEKLTLVWVSFRAIFTTILVY